MTRSQLIREVATRTGASYAVSERVVGVIFDQMTRALGQGRRVEIRGFGTFQIRQYEAYSGRNPRTQAPIHVKPKVLPHFRAGKEIRERINEPGS